MGAFIGNSIVTFTCIFIGIIVIGLFVATHLWIWDRHKDYQDPLPLIITVMIYISMIIGGITSYLGYSF